MLILICLYIQQVLTRYSAKQVNISSAFQQYRLTATESQFTKNGQSIQLESQLILEIRYESQNQIDIQIYDEAQKHFRIPKEPPFDYNDIEDPEPENDYDFQVFVNSSPLKVEVKRDDRALFTIQDLVFSETYIEFTHIPQNKQMWGLGERNQVGFRFKEGIYTLYARDEPDIIEDGKRPGKHVYSSHPVLLSMEESGKFNVMFYKSSQPMDVEHYDQKMKFITIGGIIHIKLFLGDNYPKTAIKQYHQYLGGWMLPPFWGFGFHQCRWGYKNSSVLIQVVTEYQKQNIPIDIIWTDLDYMDDRQIFSVDFERFPKKDYQYLKGLGVRYIPLLDVAVGVKYGELDLGYKRGTEYDVFLYSPNTGYRFQGYVWPGDSFFPDFFHPNISSYWNEMHQHLYSQVQFDGLWVDMNEPANFCEGECDASNPRRDHPKKQDRINPQTIYPYIPGQLPLANKTLPPNLLHYGNHLHKDVHNLYGFMDSYYTYQAQKALGKVQPFQITRSTFPGSGKYAQHWTGDNGATWDFLYLSLGQVFQFQIFGIPMVGADVCGFMHDTTDKLCARWVQLGIFYPFFRNHNNDLSESQEFYKLGYQVIQAAKKNIHLRYSILKWFYMLFVRENNNGPVVNPLFFVFPTDYLTYRDFVMDTQLLLGVELMGAPILQDGVTRTAYFPETNWYDFTTGLEMKGKQDHTLYCAYNDLVPLFIRSGYLVVQNTVEKIKNIKSLDNHYRIIAALDENKSIGNFLDLVDFEDEEQAINAKIIDITLEVDEQQVKLSISECSSLLIIDEIYIYGLPCKSKTCTSGYYKHNSVFKGPFNLGQKNLEKILSF